MRRHLGASATPARTCVLSSFPALLVFARHSGGIVCAVGGEYLGELNRHFKRCLVRADGRAARV